MLAGTAEPAGTVLQCSSVARKVGVNDEAQIGQINTARCHVRRHAYTRTAVPQSLHGMIALILAMLARKRDSIEPALNKAGMQAPNAFARRAEDHGKVRFMETQKVDDAVFNSVRRPFYGLLSDCAIPAIRARGDGKSVV